MSPEPEAHSPKGSILVRRCPIALLVDGVSGLGLVLPAILPARHRVRHLRQGIADASACVGG
jgi:hypothetical protein